MLSENVSGFDEQPSTLNVDRVGWISAMATLVLTIITFGFALIAIPVSGANCPANCVDYPYLNTAGQFPRDFMWMIPAMALMLAYVTLMGTIHATTPDSRKALSQMGWTFAVISAVILLMDYYVQFAVVPVSLINEETLGLPLLIQYNPHGLFIALEELGYWMMSLSFLVMAFTFPTISVVRWVFLTAVILVVLSFVVISFQYGLERQDRFEVVIITINWLVLIVNGVFLSARFRRRLNANPEAE